MPCIQCHTSDTCQVLHVDTSQIHFFLTVSLLANSSDRWLKSKSKWCSFSKVNLVQQQASEIPPLQDQIQATLQLQSSRVKIFLEDISKEQVTPHNMPPVELYPVADSRPSSSPLCSTMNHHFKVNICDNHPDLDNSMKQIPENNQGPHKICWSGKNSFQCLCVLTHNQMSRDALFGSTNILSTRKATNQEQRVVRTCTSNEHGNLKKPTTN